MSAQAKSLMVDLFKPIPARKEGASNPDYLRFLHRVKTARGLIEKNEGASLSRRAEPAGRRSTG